MIVSILSKGKFVVWKNLALSTLQGLAHNYQKDLRNLNRNLSLSVDVCGRRKAASNTIVSTDFICRCFLTFRHRASSILGQAFHYSPENAFYIFNQQIYFII